MSARRLSRTLRATAAGLVVLAGAVSRTAAQEPPPEAEIRSLSAECRGGHLLVSYHLQGGMTEVNLERLLGGLEVRFVHELKVQTRRGLFGGATLLETTLETTVTYDTLAKRWTLTRFRAGAQLDTRSADTESEMRTFMETVQRVDLGEAPRTGHGVLRIKTAYQQGLLFMLLPWSYSATRDKDLDFEAMACR